MTFYPLLRRFFSPIDYGDPSQESACTYSPYEVVKCGNDDDKILMVEPENPCCCKVPCDIYPGSCAACKCFVGVQDDTGNECDIRYAIQVSGPLVPPGCDAVIELTEGLFDGDTSGCCNYRLSCYGSSPGSCTINPDNATNFPDCDNANTQTISLFLSGQISCGTDPCGDAGYRVAISAGTFHPYPCGTPTQCGQPLQCNAVGSFVAWIATDTCGCMKPGEYKAYCYSFPPTFSPCVSTNSGGNCPDPFGLGALHTITITKLSDDDCKPCDCATPPCNDGGPTLNCGYGEI